MRRLSRVAARRTGLLVCTCLMLTSVSACKKDDAVQRLVLDALSKAMASPRTFIHTDQDLQHRTTVSGEVADSLRYRLLLNVDGQGIWQQVVRDDAVGDLFLDPSKVSTYAGAGSSPAIDVVSDFQQLVSVLPPKARAQIPSPPLQKLPKTQNLRPTLALLALQQKKWVVDPAGAPVLPSVGTASEALATSPFLRPLLMLEAVRQEVDRIDPKDIKKWTKDDLSPTFKPKDDPFPVPESGVDRYDVKQTDLPQLTATSKGSRPEPPEDASLRKLAIYLKDGKVIAIRENYDVLDRLEDIARLYQIPLQLKSATGTQMEQRIGQLLVELVQQERPVPYRVHEEDLLIGYPKTAPVIDLPTPHVTADLSLFPGQGKLRTEPTTTTPTPEVPAPNIPGASGSPAPSSSPGSSPGTAPGATDGATAGTGTGSPPPVRRGVSPSPTG